MTIKLHRRQMVLASLIFALGVAVYLNWQFSSRYIGFKSESVNSSEAHYIDAPINPNDTKTITKTDNYYDNARENRELAYKQCVETLKTALSDSNIDEKTKINLENQYSEMAKICKTQANVENLAKAKGYKECIAIIQNGECYITASPGNSDKISENDSDKHAIRLCNIVQSQTGFGKDKIKVVIKT